MSPTAADRCYRLTYVSRANQAMTRAALVELLAQSREHNTAHGITGLLVYRDLFFVQLLEGEHERVEALYARIAADPRHRDVVLVETDRRAVRQFPDWTMGFHDLTDGVDDLDGYNDVLNGDHRMREETELVHDLLDLFDPARGSGATR